jgi:hypothetical protein
LLGLDLTVVASCCSVELDPVAASGVVYVAGPRVVATVLGVLGAGASIGAAVYAARAPSRRRLVAAGAVSLVAFPAAVAATILEVAPHAFEAPQHVCPFCLLRGDVLAIGYPLFGALFVATVSLAAAAASAILSRDDAALHPFAKSRLKRGATAWLVALVIAALPIARFALVSDGASLFTVLP